MDPAIATYRLTPFAEQDVQQMLDRFALKG